MINLGRNTRCQVKIMNEVHYWAILVRGTDQNVFLFFMWESLTFFFNNIEAIKRSTSLLLFWPFPPSWFILMLAERQAFWSPVALLLARLCSHLIGRIGCQSLWQHVHGQIIHLSFCLLSCLGLTWHSHLMAAMHITFCTKWYSLSVQLRAALYCISVSVVYQVN